MAVREQPAPGRRRRAGFVGVFLAVALLSGTILALSLAEARRVQITTPVVRIPGLPQEFAGLRIAFLADVHRGPFMSERRLMRIVHRANERKPDVVALGGDYVHHSRAYIASVWRALGGLHAPFGVYGVLGNHDHWESAELSRAAMKHVGVADLSNRHVRLERGGKRMFIAGVDDPWAGHPDLQAALQGVGPDDVVVLICHNPDYIEKVSDPRVKLWLCGHTHGGQVCFPSGRPLVNISRCGLRYVSGLSRCQETQIYTTRGIGTVAPPVRWNCPAELPIIELQPG